MDQRFFVPSEQISKSIITISGSDAFQIKNVLRLNVKDGLTVLDGTGKVYASKIRSVEKGRVTLDIISTRSEKSELETKVTLIQSIPREAKMDLIIQKCTELGMFRMIPVVSERTIIKLDGKKKAERGNRWQRIAKEASEQSGRGIVPAILPICALENALKEAQHHEVKLIPWEMEEKLSIKDALLEDNEAKHIALAIGPEGGFSANEVKLAMEYGFRPVTLGKRILRTETAGMAALSMINYEFEL